MKRVLLLFSVIFAVGWSLSEEQPMPDPVTPDELGEILFHDPILSLDSTISCASCHKPEFAFSDTSAFSLGVGGHLTRRNAPSIMNTLSRDVLMWDGRAATLEDQALLPLEHPGEMNMHRDSAIARLNRTPRYKRWFNQMYKRDADVKLLCASIAYFQRRLETSDTPHDRWLADKTPGLTEQQVRGRDIFFGKGNCLECHFTPDFTGDEFKNIGLFNGKNLDDPGRFDATKDSTDLGKFKVPGLRNVAITAPYMHNGMFKTLEEVVDFYNDTDSVVPDAINKDILIKKLNLSSQEKADLVAFLKSLTDDRFAHLLVE